VARPKLHHRHLADIVDYVFELDFDSFIRKQQTFNLKNIQMS